MKVFERLEKSLHPSVTEALVCISKIRSDTNTGIKSFDQTETRENHETRDR
jgi:hypothetical protein